MQKLLIISSILTWYCTSETEIANSSVASEDVQTQSVPAGESAILPCRSNDEQHHFRFWQLPQTDVVVGPGAKYDDFKYDYERLSGKLSIKKVSTAEEGVYRCVSEGVTNSDINIRSVRVVVNRGDNSKFSNFTGAIIVASLAAVVVLGYVILKIRKRRRPFQTLLVSTSDDEEDSVEELFIAPSTSGRSGNIVINRPEEQKELVEIHIPKISIDLDDDLISKRRK